MEIRRSYDRLLSTMGFPILVRWHLYIESGPWSHQPECRHISKYHHITDNFLFSARGTSWKSKNNDHSLGSMLTVFVGKGKGCRLSVMFMAWLYWQLEWECTWYNTYAILQQVAYHFSIDSPTLTSSCTSFCMTLHNMGHRNWLWLTQLSHDVILA